MIQSVRESLTEALHRQTCGTDYDEWNRYCVWAGEDWDPENDGPAACAYVGSTGVEDAILQWLSTLADDEAVVAAMARHLAGDRFVAESGLRALAAALQ